MKKLIYLIPFLVLTSLYADTSTTGDMKLLLPTVGARDTTRNWGDKYNENFKIIDSTLSALTDRVDAVATDTGSVRTDLTNFFASSGTEMILTDASEQTKAGSLTISGNLTFQTTYYMPATFPFAVGNTTNAVTVSSDALNGHALLDGQSSTPGLNTCFFKVMIPENFVAGSTPILTVLGVGTTGFVDAQESWVLSFATGSSHLLVISTGSGAPSLNFSSAVVVNVTGQTSVNGGERFNKTNRVLDGVTNMLGSGDCVLYIRAVRDGTSANDVSDSRSAIVYMCLAGKFQQ